MERTLESEGKRKIMSYKIQKGSVQETLVIPLYGRKLAMDMYPDIFADRECQELFDRIEYEFKAPGKFKSRIGALMAATRQYDMASVCREYLKAHPKACVVNIGCGLDTTFKQVDNGTARGYNLDFPDVIAVRNELLPETERERNLAVDVKASRSTVKTWEKDAASGRAARMPYPLRMKNLMS